MPDANSIQPKDGRGFFMLPQAPEDAGYYVYGTPGQGAFHFAHPAMLSVLLYAEREWAAIDHRKFGIGNISLASGPDTEEHDSHEDGLQVDVRPLRKDGQHRPVTWRQLDEYDAKATSRLIDIFFSHPFVKTILFNDRGVHPRVKSWPAHDNHFHVAIKAPEVKK